MSLWHTLPEHCCMSAYGTQRDEHSMTGAQDEDEVKHSHICCADSLLFWGQTQKRTHQLEIHRSAVFGSVAD